MNKTAKQFISLISLVFISQLLFPQFSHAQTAYDWSGDDSIVFIKNSSQSILSDAGTPVDNETVKITVSEHKNSDTVSVGSINEVKEEPEEVKPIIDEKAEIKAYVLAEAKKMGLNPREVELIVHCESTWNPKATHKNRNGSIDAGLWQINSIHKNLTFEEKMDYKVATKWALEKRLRDGNWSAWYCARKVGIR